MDVEISGFQEMIDTLEKMDKDGEKIFKQALNEGAKPVLTTMKNKVYSILHRRTGELQKNIKIGTVRKGKSGSYSQIIGISKGDVTKAWYGKNLPLMSVMA
jgi:HK97 gp10 family phage protein